MRILHLVESFGFFTTTFIETQVSELAKDHDVLLVCINREVNEKKFNFEICVLQYEANIWIKRIRRRLRDYNISLNFYLFKFSKCFNRIVSDFRPDVIHCQFGPDALKFIDNLFYRKNDIPIFVQFRGYDASMMLQVNPVYVRRWRKLVCQGNIFPVFVSEYLYNNFIKHNIIPDRRRILYSCTDVEKFKRLEYPSKSTKTYLQISSFVEKKGHIYTVNAFSRFLKLRPNLDCRLVLAGDGPLRHDIILLVARLGLSDRIIMPGRISHLEARDWMEKSHYFVHHSITTSTGDSEGIPNAIMEAMAMELPIISTYHSGIPELVEDGVNGLLIQERDVDSYVECLITILDWTFISVNRVKIVNEFEKSRHTTRLLGFYNDQLLLA